MSAANLERIADALDPGKVFCFLPTASSTFCNCAVHCFMTALGVPFAEPGIKANAQHEWLADPANGWCAVDVQGAADAANLGMAAIASYFNPTGSGHIGVVLPGSTADVPLVWCAGRRCYRRAPLKEAFGGNPVDFFTYTKEQ